MQWSKSDAIIVSETWIHIFLVRILELIFMNSNRTKSSQDRPSGEIYVWLTAMGLAIGLLMIISLLGLILKNGVAVFWPKPVAEITFREEAPGYRGSRTVAGVITQEKNIDIRDLTPEQLTASDPAVRREKQLFMGNRDRYGESFAFFTLGDIEKVEYPAGLIHAERMEWGDGIFYPLAIERADGSRITVEDPQFDTTLRALVNEVGERRERINEIERGKIGPINAQLRAAEMDERYLVRQDPRTPQQEQQLAEARQRIATLMGDYRPLAARAQELRAEQRLDRLHYRLPTGEAQSQVLGEFVHYYWPNQLSLWDKVQLFFYHIWEFLSGFPREANTEGGIFPAIFGTFVMTLLMSLAVTPFGVLAAIYLREYAKQGLFVRAVRIAINNLAGVPSIVFGIFGLGFFVYFLGGNIDQLFFPRSVELGVPTFGTGGVLWASLTLALMTVPVVIVATEEALAAVSRGVREGALACGASKWQTIRTLVLPASAPGILTGLVLAMARGAGEVAPLMLVGVVALAPNLPIDGLFPFIHFERKFMHLGFHIYDLGFQSPDSEAARPMVFATTLVLILLVIILNLGAILIRNRLRRKYLSSAF